MDLFPLLMYWPQLTSDIGGAFCGMFALRLVSGAVYEVEGPKWSLLSLVIYQLYFVSDMRWSCCLSSGS